MIELYNRIAYSIFILEIPYIKGKELEQAVRYKMLGLYPGDISEKQLQIKKNASKKWSYIVMILDKDVGSVMLPLSPFFIQYLFPKQSLTVVLMYEDWVEFSILENGCLVKSAVITRDNERILADISGYDKTVKELTIICDQADKFLFSPLFSQYKISFLNTENELRKIDLSKISLFSEKSPIVKRRRVLLTIISVTLMTTAIMLIYQHRKAEFERKNEERFYVEEQMKLAEERQQQSLQLLELQSYYSKIISDKNITPFDMAWIISGCRESGTRLQSVTFNNNFFQIEGITRSSLDLLANFEKHRQIHDVTLHHVNPSRNMDSFSISGMMLPEVEIVDSNMPIQEQIAIYKVLIEREERRSQPNEQLSQSAFGQKTRTLLLEYGAHIISYRFTAISPMMEIEYSIRCSSAGYFNFLFSIRENHSAWEISRVQIRNLYPQNILDIVFLIKTKFPNEIENNPQDFEQLVSPMPYSITAISHNFFTPVASGVTAQMAVRQEVPTIPQARTEMAAWLEYIGTVTNNETSFIFVKNSRTGEIIRLSNAESGDMRYVIKDTNTVIAHISNQILEITRR
jgi:hypothetical protein